MNSIYSNVDDMLKREESLVEIINIEMGTVNKNNLTVPINFILTPKEVSENTIV